MEGEIRERVLKGRHEVGSLAGGRKGRNVSMGVKRDLRNSILLPALTYGSQNWTWSKVQQSKSACCRDELSERSVWGE